MKTTHIVLSAMLAASFITSCNNKNGHENNENGNTAGTEQKSEDPKKNAEDHNDAKFESRMEEKDAQFLVDAATINLEEVALGEMASTKGKMADVKELGKMMKDAHEKAMNQLKGLAAKKQVTLPDAMPDKVKKDVDKYSEKKDGKDFDKDYCDKMVDGHKDAISKFEKASTDAADADVRTWAAEMLPELRKHLDHAMACQEKCKKAYK